MNADPSLHSAKLLEFKASSGTVPKPVWNDAPGSPVLWSGSTVSLIAAETEERSMKIIQKLSVLSSAALLASCSSFGQGGNTERVATGAGIGAAVGAAAGAVLGGVSPVHGAVAGAVAGGVAGAITKKDRRYFRDENGQCYYVTSAGGRVYDPRGCVDVVERR